MIHSDEHSAVPWTLTENSLTLESLWMDYIGRGSLVCRMTPGLASCEAGTAKLYVQEGMAGHGTG